MNSMRFPLPTLAAALALTLLAATPAWAREPAAPMQVPASGVIGVEEAYLSPEFWVSRLAQDDAGTPDRVVMDRAAIEAQNARLLRMDDSMHDLRALPASLYRAQVAAWIEGLSQRPERQLYDVDHKPVPAATLDAIVANLDLDANGYAGLADRYGNTVTNSYNHLDLRPLMCG